MDSRAPEELLTLVRLTSARPWKPFRAAPVLRAANLSSKASAKAITLLPLGHHAHPQQWLKGSEVAGPALIEKCKGKTTGSHSAHQANCPGYSLCHLFGN